MKLRGLLAASMVLAVVSGVLWWSNRRETRASKATTEVKPAKLFNTPEDQIQEIKIQKQGTGTIDLRRTAGKWQIVAPKQFAADQEAVSSLISNFSSVNPDHVIEEHPASVDPYGLTQPSLKVTVIEKNNQTHDLLVGDQTPAGSAAYAEAAGDPRVFTIASYVKNDFDKSVNDLRDKRLLNFETDKVSRLELTAKKQTIEFGRDKDRWQILKPKPLRAEQFAVDDLVRSLHDAKMELSASDDEKKFAAAFNSGTAVASAKVTDVAGTQELQVRKNKDDYYAKSSAVAGIYKVLSSTETSMDKSLEDFRNKKLFDFGFTDPDKIEIHDGAKSYLLTHSGSDWWSNGIKMDEASVTPLIGAIRDLTASKFLDTGFATPVMDVMVTSDSGKRVEKVLISRDGDHVVAKRENEPALYELPVSSLTDLQNSAAGVKAAPPPAALPAPKKK